MRPRSSSPYTGKRDRAATAARPRRASARRPPSGARRRPARGLSCARVTGPLAHRAGHAVRLGAPGTSVNRDVERLAHELAGRGHRVVIVAPGSSHGARAREPRARIRQGGDAAASPPTASAARARRRRGAAAGRAAQRGAAGRRRAHGRGALHARRRSTSATSTSRSRRRSPVAALRHSRALNVGTFHAPTERVVATPGRAQGRRARPRPARRARWRASRRRATLAAALLPGRLPRRARPARRARSSAARPAATACASLFVEHEERPALRRFLRALRLLEDVEGWEALVRQPPRPVVLDAAARRAARARALRDARRAGRGRGAGRRADVLVAASDGAAPAPGLVLRALGAGAVPVALAPARLRGGRCDDGEAGLLFEPRDDGDARRPARAALIGRRGAARPAAGARSAPRPVERGRRRARGGLRGRPGPPPRRRAATRRSAARLRRAAAHRRRPAHAHRPLPATARRRSRCCWTPPASRASARSRSPTTTRSPARSRRRPRRPTFGVKVIVGEEVKTASQGEVIGLFLTEKIPRGLTLAETVAEIKRQGGLVYVPAPVRPHARGARLRAPADDRRRRRRDRGLQPARGDRLVQRGGRALRGQVPDRRAAPARTPTSPRAWARCASGCATSTGRRSSSSRCARRRSSRSRRACSTCRR